MTKKCLSPSQSRTVPGILEDIASIYKNDPKEALQYRLEALNVQKNLKPINYILNKWIVEYIEKMWCVY